MNIYVGNLSYNMTEQELKNAFQEYGSVVKATLITDRNTGRSKGFGFIEMESKADGEKAISNLDGSDVGGRKMKVNEARPRD